jgi:hypothetical protein
MVCFRVIRWAYTAPPFQSWESADASYTSLEQANYINALAVSVSPFFEPAEVTLGGLFFSPWVDFL